MKSSADAPKPAEEEKKKVEEPPADKFYGKSLSLILQKRFCASYRVKEVAGAAWEGRKGERLQNGCFINQIIQKAAENLHTRRHRPRYQVLHPRPLLAPITPLPADSPRGNWEYWG